MNRGAVETRRAIERRGLSINKAADMVKSDGGTFSKILREEQGRKPGRALAARILAEFGVPPDLWDQQAADAESQPFDADQATQAENPASS